MSALIEVASSNSYYFTNTLDNDLVIYPSTETQNIFLGCKMNSNANVKISTSNVSLTSHSLDSNNGIRLYTSNNTERMCVLGNGNVGIGTSYPAYTVDVTGSGRLSSLMYLNKNNYYYATWALNSNFAITGGGTVTLSSSNTWTTVSSNNGSSLMNSSGQLTAPLSGIWNIAFTAVFNTGTTENGFWIQNSNLNHRIAVVQGTSRCLSSSWTGYLNSNDKCVPHAWAASPSTLTGDMTVTAYPYGVMTTYLSYSLIQPLV